MRTSRSWPIPLLSLAAVLSTTALASADSIQINIPGTANPTFVYAEENGTSGGEAGVCASGGYTGAAWPQRTWANDSVECQQRDGETEVPDDVTGEAPCSDQTTCQEAVEEAVGGAGAPTPDDNCPSASSSSGATCVDLGDGRSVVVDSPEDQQAEVGFCNQGDYYFASGPTDQDASPGGEACPTAAPANPPPPPADKDGDGVADANDRCPTTAASTSDGCPAPAPEPSGTTNSGGDDGSTDDGGGAPAPAESSPPPPERARVDILRQRITVGRRRAAIPVECQTVRTACGGTLRLTATRRGRRILVGEGVFQLEPGETAKVAVAFTRAGRRLVASGRRIETTARTAVETDAGTVVRRETLALRLDD